MSGTGATSISGMRAPGKVRRAEARQGARVTPYGISVHIVILGLAVLLWWIARDMVSVTQQLNNAGRVRFELSEELQGQWRVFSQSSMPVTLEVSGPTKEINDFAADLDQNPGRFAYRYEVSQSDIANLPVNSRQQVQLAVDLGKFQPTGEAVAPPELRVRPMSGGEQSVFTVVLERYVARPALIDLGASARGQIQMKFDRPDGASVTRAYQYTAEARPDKDIEVWGPASLVEANSDPGGHARLKVSIDAKQALENFAGSKALTVEQVLEQGSLVSNVQLLPIEGVTVRDTAQQLEVAFVNVRITYARLQDYVPVSRDFPIEIVLPNWLAQQGAQVLSLPSSIKVDMRVLNSQTGAFNEQNVRVRLDLSSLDRAELEIEDVPGGNVKRAKVMNWWYSLVIDTERLTYEFSNPNVTIAQYQPIAEIAISWTED